MSAPAATRPALLDVAHIYLEPAVRGYPRGQDILARFPDAEQEEVASHWNIPGLHGNEGLIKDWVRIKKTVLVLGVRKGFPVRPNGRSADFIAPGFASGCAMACAYCYVPRRKGFANPVSTFVNLEQLHAAIARHAAKQGPKTPAQTDPKAWVYDIGENSDVSVDALVSDNVRDTVAFFRDLPNAKASFATKYVNRELLGYEPEGGTRLRVSLLPQRVAKTVDVRTTPIAERIGAINDFVAAGYEVHLNFSPVIVYEGWQSDYAELFTELDDVLSPTEGAAQGRGHLPDPQRAAARGQPGLASQSRGPALDTCDPRGQDLADGRRKRALPPRLQGAAGRGLSGTA